MTKITADVAILGSGFAGSLTALVLNRFQGLSYEEVGEVLGLKLPAVKSLLFRARENLRKALIHDLGEETDDELV